MKNILNILGLFIYLCIAILHKVLLRQYPYQIKVSNHTLLGTSKSIDQLQISADRFEEWLKENCFLYVGINIATTDNIKEIDDLFTIYFFRKRDIILYKMTWM